MVFTFLENALNLRIFLHAPAPQSKFQAEFFENLFLSTAETGGAMICFIKINQKI